MVAGVPSLEGKIFLTDIESVIAYQWNKFSRVPKGAMPILSDLIISLPQLVAQFGSNPQNLTANIQSDLQNCFNRIYNITAGNPPQVTVTANYTMHDNGGYDVTVTFLYQTPTDQLAQIATSIALGEDGRLTIPEASLGGQFWE